ncbi:hypothetical protein Taro_015939 [Colocasia esculenta]|uniref:Uncharacterized protein n=1 Tax=Colocasia esculenta TaxID=4460 RepID=A0A843UMI0_COLES|nr:hypothetical protein [Colocasia esculenta]
MAWVATAIRVVSRPGCPSRQAAVLGGSCLSNNRWSGCRSIIRRALFSVLFGGAPVSLAMPCVPALADGPSGGCSRKGCRACLWSMGLSGVRASGAVSVSVCHASSLSPGARHLRACPRDKLLLFPGTPSPARLCQKVLLRAAGMLKSLTWSRRGKRWGNGLRGGSTLVRCGPASPSHCLALRWFRSHVGRSGVGPQFGRTAWVYAEGLLPHCVALAQPSLRVVALLYFLPHVFDSAGSAGVVFGLTRVVVESSFASALLEFLLLWLIRGWRCDLRGSLVGVREVGSLQTQWKLHEEAGGRLGDVQAIWGSFWLIMEAFGALGCRGGGRQAFEGWEDVAGCRALARCEVCAAELRRCGWGALEI